MKRAILLTLIACLSVPFVNAADKPAPHPKVRMTTSLGAIEIELDQKRAPKTVANFLGYVDKGFYNGTIFHRVIPGFMIQGGGFEHGMKQKKTDAPILNEADNGLKNDTGTIAMARTASPHSASAQFFINTVDNTFLNHRGKTAEGWGYAVFGKVTKGMDVVKKIEAAKTKNTGGFEALPVAEVVIKRVERVKN